MKNGLPKIAKKWPLPTTTANSVSRIFTGLAVFGVDRKAGESELVEFVEGVALGEVRAKTDVLWLRSCGESRAASDAANDPGMYPVVPPNGHNLFPRTFLRFRDIVVGVYALL